MKQSKQTVVITYRKVSSMLTAAKFWHAVQMIMTQLVYQWQRENCQHLYHSHGMRRCTTRQEKVAARRDTVFLLYRSTIYIKKVLKEVSLRQVTVMLSRN